MGSLGDLDTPTSIKKFLYLLLFYAGKTVALQCICTDSPCLSLWKKLITQKLPLYKLTCEARVCALKFNKIWEWLATADTCDTSTLLP